MTNCNIGAALHEAAAIPRQQWSIRSKAGEF
jgi:hypothetical protein